MLEFIPIQKRTISAEPLVTELQNQHLPQHLYWHIDYAPTELCPPFPWHLPPQLLDPSEPRVFSSREPATAATAVGLFPKKGQLPVGSCPVYPVPYLTIVLWSWLTGWRLPEDGGIGPSFERLPCAPVLQKAWWCSWLLHPCPLVFIASLNLPWLLSTALNKPRRLSWSTWPTLASESRYSHVSEGNFSQQYQADRVSLRGVAVVGALGHHVSKVDPLPKHVARLQGWKRADG